MDDRAGKLLRGALGARNRMAIANPVGDAVMLAWTTLDATLAVALELRRMNQVAEERTEALLRHARVLGDHNDALSRHSKALENQAQAMDRHVGALEDFERASRRMGG